MMLIRQPDSLVYAIDTHRIHSLYHSSGCGSAGGLFLKTVRLLVDRFHLNVWLQRDSTTTWKHNRSLTQCLTSCFINVSVILLLPQTETTTFVLAVCSIKVRAHKSLSRLIKKYILYLIIADVKVSIKKQNT